MQDLCLFGVGLLISTLVHSSAVANDSYSSYYESDEFDPKRRLDDGAHGGYATRPEHRQRRRGAADAVLRSLVVWGFGSGHFQVHTEDVDWTLHGSDLILDLPVPTAEGRTFAEVEEWLCLNNAVGNTRETFASLVEGVLPAPVVVTAVCHSDSVAQSRSAGRQPRLRRAGAAAAAATRLPPPPPPATRPPPPTTTSSGERWLWVPVALALGALSSSCLRWWAFA